MNQYRVTYERVGRHHEVPPLETTAADADQLADRIYKDARRYLASRGVEIVVDLEAMKGSILCGFHNGGSFTIERLVEVDA